MHLTDYDRAFYAEHIAPHLPDSLWDCHAHVYKREFDPDAHVGGDWMYAVARENPEAQLLDTYAGCFPGKTVRATIFGMPAPQVDIDASNRYVREVSDRQGFARLALVHPAMTREQLEAAVEGFAGIKVYLSFAPSYIPRGEIRIFDFLTEDMLRLCDERRLTVMLHIPRAQRLRDPLNLAQMLAIESAYPHLTLIIAHVGRAYCEEDLGEAFSLLRDTGRMCFDISANTSQPVFEALLEAIPPERILYGTDLPILAMRAGRVTEKGVYYNIVPRGAYGDLTGVPNMRETDDTGAMTLLLYEGIAAFLRAARAKGLSRQAIDRVFHDNAAALWAREGR